MSGPGAVRNPFDSASAARRYAGARPYYHRSALDLAMEQQEIQRARLALDVGCGTGLSARAVSDLADHVVAVDVSTAMLRAAQPHRGVRYLAAAAERIPLRDAVADLAAAGGAFHWFDQPSALAELARVLRDGAVLVVYTDFFHGRVEGQPSPSFQGMGLFPTAWREQHGRGRALLIGTIRQNPRGLRAVRLAGHGTALASPHWRRTRARSSRTLPGRLMCPRSPDGDTATSADAAGRHVGQAGSPGSDPACLRRDEADERTVLCHARKAAFPVRPAGSLI